MKNFFLLSFIFASCRSSDEVSIPDASKDTTIEIKTKTSYPTTLTLDVKGETNDTFIINNIQLPGGILDTIIKFDCYTKDFQINFQSYKVSKGSIIIKYRL